jgi:hypothetical protein
MNMMISLYFLDSLVADLTMILGCSKMDYFRLAFHPVLFTSFAPTGLVPVERMIGS